MRVLITSASRKVVLVRSFRKESIVYVTDIDPLSPAIYLADFFYKAPLTESPEFPSFLLELVKKESIDMVIPTTDDDLRVVSSIRENLLNLGAFPLVSSPEVVSICNDKWETFLFFKRERIPTPETFLGSDLAGERAPTKLVLKKRFGRGSRGMFLVEKGEAIPDGLGEEYIAQRYVEGKEFTLDAFVDLEGRVISVVPRERIKVSEGVSVRGRTVKSKKLIDWGREICRLLKPLGPINIQCIWGEEGILFTEINPRFSGGIALTLASGADFVRWSLSLARGETLTPSYDFKELYMSCYNEPVFFESPLGGCSL